MKTNFSKTPASLRARLIATRTASRAYSFDRYGMKEWTNAAELLFLEGMDECEVEAILMSKWVRWAADKFETEKRSPKGADLIAWMYEPKTMDSKRKRTKRDVAVEVSRLVLESF